MKKSLAISGFLALAIIVAFLASPAGSSGHRPAGPQKAPALPDASLSFNKTDMMIPMRDGVKLHTEIYAPKDAKEPLPFVFQDIRGRFGSEGQFVMQRDPRDTKDSKSIDEGTDAYDTIDWLVKNVPNNNGRVGIWGISYPGWLGTQALLGPHA